MKFATYQDGSRDGQLVLVSRDLTMAHYPSDIANRLQQVLDDWGYLAPALRDLYDSLNAGRLRNAFAFEPSQCLAPLPRAYQWVSTSSYPGHAELLRKAYASDPSPPSENGCASALAQHGSGDHFFGPHAPIVCPTQGDAIDFEAGLTVITDDIAMHSSPEQALEKIRLITLVNDVRLQTLPSTDAQTQHFAHIQSKLATAFAPVAVTVDELGEAWNDARVQLPLQCTWNTRKVGMCDAACDMPLHFGHVLAQLCKTRALRAGSIVGSGPVSNFGVERDGRMDWPKGYSAIVQKRAMEILQDGKATTEFMQCGDTIHIEMRGRDGLSIFGAIAQEVVAPPQLPPKKARS